MDLQTGFRQAIIDNLPVAVFCKDVSDGYRFVLWNKKQEDVTGIRREDALGKTDFDLFPAHAAAQFRRVDEYVMLTNATLEIPEEEVQTGVPGESAWLRTVKTPVEDPATGRSWLLGVSEDITESKLLHENLNRTSDQLKETQLQLIQAEKMESIGRMAAGVAHEVKNPLALLLMGVEYLDGGVDPNDENLPVIITEMREAIHRADKIIRGLVDFSSSRQLDLQLHDVRASIDQALLLVRHDLTRMTVQVDLDHQQDLPSVLIDTAKFEQVMVNLLINAIHAMEGCDKPAILCRTRARQVAGIGWDEGARTVERMREGDIIVTVELCDNGSGIPPEKLSKVFDPFFTTKPTGVGTGLGLSVVRNIIELHKGKISISNRPEGGVRVLISLRTRAKHLAPADSIQQPKKP